MNHFYSDSFDPLETKIRFTPLRLCSSDSSLKCLFRFMCEWQRAKCWKQRACGAQCFKKNKQKEFLPWTPKPNVLIVDFFHDFFTNCTSMLRSWDLFSLQWSHCSKTKALKNGWLSVSDIEIVHQVASLLKTYTINAFRYMIINMELNEKEIDE